MMLTNDNKGVILVLYKERRCGIWGRMRYSIFLVILRMEERQQKSYMDAMIMIIIMMMIFFDGWE